MSRNILGLHALVLYADFPANTPERAAFKAHLVQVAVALREIEHAELGETRPDAEARAIRECLDTFCASPAMLRAANAGPRAA